MLHHLFRINVRIFHISFHAFYDLAKVMGRNACRHSDGYAFRAVNQDIRHLHGQNKRLFFRFIKIRAKIDDIFIQVR